MGFLRICWPLDLWNSRPVCYIMIAKGRVRMNAEGLRIRVPWAIGDPRLCARGTQLWDAWISTQGSRATASRAQLLAARFGSTGANAAAPHLPWTRPLSCRSSSARRPPRAARCRSWLLACSSLCAAAAASWLRREGGARRGRSSQSAPGGCWRNRLTLLYAYAPPRPAWRPGCEQRAERLPWWSGAGPPAVGFSESATCE